LLGISFSGPDVLALHGTGKVGVQAYQRLLEAQREGFAGP